MTIRAALKDILAGSVFIVFGVAFAAIALTYDVGTTFDMGPGYFPLALGGILALLGILIIGKGFIAGEGQPIGHIPWRSVILITAAILFFALTVRGLGLVPALLVTVALAGFAEPRAGVLWPIAIAIGLTVLSVLIFVVGLQLRLPLLGSWLPL
jgi:Tripartite tricarboxylate transporter TctB family